MAIKAEDLLVKIKIDGDNATANIKELEKQVKSLQNQLSKTDPVATSFVDNFTKVNLGIFAFANNVKMGVAALENFFQKFEDDIDATTRFGFALENVSKSQAGELTDKVEKLSKEMQRLGIAEDDQVVSLSAVAAAAGASAKQIEEITKAAAGISTIKPNVSFAEAFTSLQRSLIGNTKGIKLLAPELEGMSDEAIKAGDAIAYLADSYGPYAQKNLDLYSGRMKAAKFALGDITEEAGKAVAELINLPGIINAAAASFKAISDSIKGFSAALKDPDVQTFIISITAATAAMGAFALANDAAGLSILAANLKFVSVQALKATVSMGGFVFAVAGVATAGAAIATIYDNFKQLSDIISGLSKGAMDGIVLGFNKLLTVGLKIIQDVITPFKNLPVISEFFTANEKNIKSLDKAAVGLSKSIDKNLKVAVEGFANLDTSIFDKASKALYSLGKSAPEVAKVGDAAKKAALEFNLLSDEANKAIEAIKTKLKEAEKAAASAGLEGVAKISAEAKEASREIDVMVETIRKGSKKGIVPPEALENIKKLRALTTQAYDKQIITAYSKAVADLTKETISYEQALSNQSDLTLDRIENQRIAQRKLVDLKREELAVQGLLAKGFEVPTKAQAEIADQLERQKKAIDGAAAQSAKSAPGREYEGMVRAGQDTSNLIMKAFTSGTTGLVTGAMTAVGAVADTIQGLIDFLPQTIDKIAGVFKSLTDLPAKLTASVGNLIGSLDGYLKNYLANFTKAIGDIANQLVDFLDKLPDAITEGVFRFVDAVAKLFDRAPDIIQRAITALVDHVPEIAIRLSDVLIRRAPEIAWKMIKLMAVELPLAIVKGIIKGIANIGSIIWQGITGKLPKIKIDTQPVKDLIKNLSGVTSNIFKVEDIGAKASNYVQDLMDKIGNGFQKGANWIGQAWEKIKNWFGDVWDRIAKFFGSVWASIGMLWETVKEFGSKIWEGFKTAISAGWDFVKQIGGQIWEGLKSAIGVAWDFVKSIGQGIWDGLSAALAVAWRVIADIGKTIFAGLAESVILGWSFIKGIGGSIWTGLKEAVGSAWDWLKDIGKKIWEGFKDGLGSIGSDVIKGGGNILTTIGKGIGGLFSAEGGPVPSYLAMGGFPLQPRGTDTIPAMLTPGEFIVSRKGVDNIGVDNLRAINAGRSTGQAQSTTVNISVNVDAKTNIDPAYVRNTLIPSIRDELKRASQNGDFVLSARGIR